MTLEGAVGEVIEQEWESLSTLLYRMEAYRDERGTIWDSSWQFVPLSKISRIARVLSLPGGWLMYVSTTREDPGYLDHLTLIARSLSLARIVVRQWSTIYRAPIELCSILSGKSVGELPRTYASHYVAHIVQDGDEGCEASIAVLRNELSFRRSETDAYIEMDWCAILDVMQRMGAVPSSMTRNTLASLMGMGNVHSPTFESHIRIRWCIDRDAVCEGDMGDSMRHAYLTGFASIPEDIHPQYLNLDPILGMYHMNCLGPSSQHGMNHVVGAVPFLHEYVLFKGYDLRKSVHDTMTKASIYIRILGESPVVGEEGLRRILVILRNALQNNMGQAEEVMYWGLLVGAIESRLQQ